MNMPLPTLPRWPRTTERAVRSTPGRPGDERCAIGKLPPAILDQCSETRRVTPIVTVPRGAEMDGIGARFEWIARHADFLVAHVVFAVSIADDGGHAGTRQAIGYRRVVDQRAPATAAIRRDFMVQQLAIAILLEALVRKIRDQMTGGIQVEVRLEYGILVAQQPGPVGRIVTSSSTGGDGAEVRPGLAAIDAGRDIQCPLSGIGTRRAAACGHDRAGGELPDLYRQLEQGGLAPKHRNFGESLPGIPAIGTAKDGQ